MNIHKLRSYNERLKRFIYFQNGKYYGDIKCDLIHQCSENLFDWDNAQIWVGLFDKNKKEIFVGDIFEHFGNDFFNYVEIVYDSDNCIFKFRVYGGFYYGCLVDELHKFKLSEMEIIGNDKENEDLTKWQ